MKYQQVSVDLVNMLMTACSYLALAGAAWVLLRLLQACFWLPRHFRKQDDVQKLLQDKVDRYEEYLAECEARDKLEGVDVKLEGIDDDLTSSSNDWGKTDKWRKQRESLEMLKQELNRVRDGINVTDWDYLLEENKTELNSGKGSDSVRSEKILEDKQSGKTINDCLENEGKYGTEAAEDVDKKKDK